MIYPMPLESQNQTINLMDAKIKELEQSLQQQVALNKDLNQNSVSRTIISQTP
jgi:hypothetical protein